MNSVAVANRLKSPISATSVTAAIVLMPRIALSAFTVSPTLGLVPVPPELRSQVFAAGASVGRNNRCPGSNERTTADHSNPFLPSPNYPCDASIKPIGP